MKINRYGHQIPDHWLECKTCPDMIDEDISDLYAYGLCPYCVKQVPKYLPVEQWEKWLHGHSKTKATKSEIS